MLNIGCHLSVSNGYLAMGEVASSIGANTFQFFTRNPRGSKSKKMDPVDAAALMKYMKEHSFAKILAHAPYTMNLCSAEAYKRDVARDILADDLARMELLPGNLYNMHPGSHVGQGCEIGIDFVASALNEIVSPDAQTTILLETMAGKGSELGRSFEEIKSIIDAVNNDIKIGVCLDTCHIFDGGYDIVNNLDATLDEFDRVIGLNRLHAIHLNDSLNGLGSAKDRHAGIGLGQIGKDAIAAIINHPALSSLPFYLETPNELDGYKAEIELLKSLRVS